MGEDKKPYILDGKYISHEEYTKIKYEDLRIRVPKGKKELIQEYAKTNGDSLNGFINRLIDEEMKQNE